MDRWFISRKRKPIYWLTSLPQTLALMTAVLRRQKFHIAALQCLIFVSGSVMLVPNCSHSMSGKPVALMESQVLLPTIKVLLRNANNERVVARALVDSGSQTSFCTQALVSKLGYDTYKELRRQRVSNNINQELHDLWFEFYNQMQGMSSIQVQLNVKMSNSDSVQLIGFCDASFAYGCCMYEKVIQDGNCNVNLLCAKSRNAPTDGKLTIPKPELNAAVLLSKLARFIQRLLPEISKCILFTGSKIALGWIDSLPVKLPAYMANRVHEIEKCNATWLHTPGTLNPADIISRGSYPDELRTSELWWHGPQFLTGSEYHFHMSNIEMPLSLCNKQLELANSTVFLGITLDSKLQWGPHISAQAGRLSSAA